MRYPPGHSQYPQGGIGTRLFSLLLPGNEGWTDITSRRTGLLVPRDQKARASSQHLAHLDMIIANTGRLEKMIFPWTSSDNDLRISALQKKRKIVLEPAPSRRTTFDQLMSDHPRQQQRQQRQHPSRITEAKAKAKSAFRRSQSHPQPLIRSERVRTTKALGAVDVLSCDGLTSHADFGSYVSSFLLFIDSFMVSMFFVDNFSDPVSSFHPFNPFASPITYDQSSRGK